MSSRPERRRVPSTDTPGEEASFLRGKNFQVRANSSPGVGHRQTRRRLAEKGGNAKYIPALALPTLALGEEKGEKNWFF